MTVEELIVKLSKFPLDGIVYVDTDEGPESDIVVDPYANGEVIIYA